MIKPIAHTSNTMLMIIIIYFQFSTIQLYCRPQILDHLAHTQNVDLSTMDKKEDNKTWIINKF